jgi:hypothetical protein
MKSASVETFLGDASLLLLLELSLSHALFLLLLLPFQIFFLMLNQFFMTHGLLSLVNL